MANKRRNGEGSWGRKTINGIKYYTYRDSKGKTTYGKTQKEVKEKLANKPAEYAISQKTTFGEYISNWLTFKQGEVEITTYQDYEDLINNMIINFKKYNLAKKQLNALSPRTFQQYLNALATKYSRSSIVKIWQLIKQCIKYGELQNELPVNTTALVKVPLESNVAVKKKEIPFLTVEQANQLYEVLNYRDKNNASRYKSSNNAHAIILILYTGMRMGELIALKWKNVNISQKSIYIKEAAATIKNEDGKTVSIDKIPKTKTSIRKIPLPSRALEMLKYFKENNEATDKDDYVALSNTGNKLDSANLNRTLHAMCKDANLPRLNVHALRHSYGSMLLSKGVDIKIISELLGHANISITYDIYIGINEGDKEAAIKSAFDTDE